MTSANAIGLITLFSVDLLDMFFLSLLGQEQLVAAVGFSATLLFFFVATNIGLQIAMAALVSRAEGQHDRLLAGRACSNVLVFSAISMLLIVLPAWYFLSELLSFLGASGESLEFAIAYCRILLPVMPLLAVGMCATAALRAMGDARWSMVATVSSSLVNAALDPIFIFVLGLGIQGAAIASLLARCVLVAIALTVLIGKHRLPTAFKFSQLKHDLRSIIHIGGSAALTHLAIPIGNSFVLKTMAQFGDSAVAGSAIMGRVLPVAFAAIFSLAGAIGPIIGQNAGAGYYYRVREVLLKSMISVVVYVLSVWLLLFLVKGWIIAAFDATDQAAYLITFYCNWLVGGFMFSGMLFIASAGFNNLGKAHIATAFSFSRCFLGIIPLVYLLSYWYGAPGVMMGEVLGSVIFGSVAVVVLLVWVRRLR